jgi:hypothetical protein
MMVLQPAQFVQKVGQFFFFFKDFFFAIELKSGYLMYQLYTLYNLDIDKPTTTLEYVKLIYFMIDTISKWS